LLRTSLTFTSLTSVGEIDFSLNPGLLGSDETARSQAPVARIFTQSAIASFSHKLAPRWTFQLATPFSYQGPFGKSDDSAEGLSDTTLTAGAAPSISYQLTRLDAIDLAGNTAWAKFESSEQLSSQLTLGWKRGLSTNVQGNISAGLGRTDLLSGDPVITADGEPLPNPQYFGVGGIGFTHTRQYGLDSVQLSLDARVDPFVQTVRPQATLSMASSLRVKSDVELGAGLSANAVTDSNPLPAEASGNGTTASETGLNASMGVTWGNGDLRYRTGVRASARGTHWAADPFEIREELALATFGMTWDIVPAPQQ
jgi:hypothetical protein